MRPSAADLAALVAPRPLLGPMWTIGGSEERGAGVTDDEVAVRLHDPLALSRSSVSPW